MKKILIVPCYNEAENLPTLIKEIEEYPEYDVVFINDGSTDTTKQVLEQYEYPQIHLVNNLGLSGAVQTGMLYALKHNYDVCFQIDGDGQHPIGEVSKLVDEVEKGADIVIGSRFLKKKKYKQTLLRALGAKHITLCIRMFSGVSLTDPTSGMRAYKRNVFEEIATATNERPEPDTMLFFARRGFHIVEADVEMRERMHGESYLTPMKAVHYMIGNTLSFLIVVIKTFRKRREAR